MVTSLLATKLRIPPERHHLVRRARLVEALERDIPDYRLVVIAAPAGYGKTTLLSQWAHASRLQVAWLSISEGDNDPERFLRYLLAAWADVQPAVRASPLSLLLGAMSPASDAVLAAFINAANDVAEHTVFVLDDYHLIDDPAIHQALTFLIDHLPPSLHVVLAGRGEPPLPLARYRARHHLLELRTDDLHFSLEETTRFLNHGMELELTDEQIVALQSQLEGWVGGLQLVALALQRHRDAADLIAISGRHRFISDYLSEDVLATLAEDRRRFLLQTSILDRLCGPLCDAVTGSTDSQLRLEGLELENLFLMPLDADRSWFRYHRLFAEFLQAELQRRHPEEVAGLHRRAAAWHLTHNLPEPAFDHAVAGADVEQVVEIAERYFAPKLFSGEFKVVARWLASIPEDWYASHPLLGLAQATFLVITGDFDASTRWVNDVEQRLRLAESRDRPRQLAKVAVLRCAIACFENDLPRAESYAAQALRHLRAEDLSYRADIHQALGDTYRRNGRWAEARASYLKALDVPLDPAARGRLAHIFGALADLELDQGRLRDAGVYWEKALAEVQERENWGRLPLPVIGWVYLRRGELLYERNELAAAWDHLSRGLERAELGGDIRALTVGYVLASRLKLTEGDLESATAYLGRARPLADNASFPDWASRVERCQVDLWLAQDQLRTAVDWATSMLADGVLDERPESEAARLAVAQVLIVNGDEPSQREALAMLDRLCRAAQADGRLGIQIEALMLQAVAWWRAGDRAKAMVACERSLRLAEPEGYVRRFIDYGPPVTLLLQEARRRNVLPDYVSWLLTAAGGDSPAAAGTATLIEPLSQREREVLHLMAAGLTNREIADSLSIAAETVKKHSASIFGKLGAANRTEAAAMARQLDLLD